MPLSRKLMLMNLTLIVALGVLAAALVWGVRTLRNAVTGAADEYTELRLIEQAMYHCSLAKSQMADPDNGSSDAAGDIETALQSIQEFREYQHDELVIGREHEDTEMALAERIEAELGTLLEKAQTMRHGGMDFSQIQAMDSVLFLLSQLAQETDVAGASTAAAENTVTTLIVTGALSGLIAIGSLAASIVCYWSVMNPLRRLHKGVRRIASGEFGDRLDERGSREFAELADDFNRMASELATLYTDLEDKVKSKSQELVRSERLASVGFLAAGVAHEINNPLNIISGYSEMARGWLDKPQNNTNNHNNNSGNSHDVREALDIIRQEAFRCKDITSKLLSLASAGDAERSNVALPDLVSQVLALVRGLRKYRDRTIIVNCEETAHAPVRASAAEIKQVLLNLIVNALEAAPAVTGEVRVECRRNGANVLVTVSDNGVGMSPEVRERAFEPFFSARPQQQQLQQPPNHAGNLRSHRGVGLGLSISHAIISSHGGTITAESDGPGRGSRFTLELPVSHTPEKPAAAQEALANASPILHVDVEPDININVHAHARAE